MKKKKETKKIRYWAGFCDEKLDSGFYAESPSIFYLKKDAEKHYTDVRLIEIKIISQ